MSKIGKHGIIAAIATVLFLYTIFLALSASPIAAISELGSDGAPLSAGDPSEVPQQVIEDANSVAATLLGNSQEKYDELVGQLVGMYLEASDSDFVVLFNSGGWGWNLAEASPSWWSIFYGLESELSSHGYTSVMLNYQRTVDSLGGRLDEVVELFTGYSSKAKDLASRVEFLTKHIAGLRVIIAGESNGTVISDQAMLLLVDNPQVYSIQTGHPFWYGNSMLDRTLVMTDNGFAPDSFSHGEFLTMIRASLEVLFGIAKPENDYGTILHYIRAPGHDYWWQYPEVRSQITTFLEENFELR